VTIDHIATSRRIRHHDHRPEPVLPATGVPGRHLESRHGVRGWRIVLPAAVEMLMSLNTVVVAINAKLLRRTRW